MKTTMKFKQHYLSDRVLQIYIIQLTIIKMYYILQAKLQCSVSWILDKAYRDQIPKEFKDPFYETQDVRK